MSARAGIAVVESVFERGIREINVLEERIVGTDEAADALLWEQAEHVVAQLEAGLSQRELAAQWINLRTGKPYSQSHVRNTVAVVREYLNTQPRPRFRELYNEIANATSGKVNRLLHQTGNIEWFSPPTIVQAVRDVFGGVIDLDPASCPDANTVVQATRIYTQVENGLELPWHGRVYLNPPYRHPDIERFCEKFAQHATAGEITGIVLTNNCTDTVWFGTLASVADAFCFPSSRCRYWQPDRETSTALQGQVLVYAGPDHTTFCRRFADIGLVLVRP